MNLLSLKRMLGAAVALTLAATVQATDISGAGATFPYPVYSKWADAYKISRWKLRSCRRPASCSSR